MFKRSTSFIVDKSVDKIVTDLKNLQSIYPKYKHTLTFRVDESVTHFTLSKRFMFSILGNFTFDYSRVTGTLKQPYDNITQVEMEVEGITNIAILPYPLAVILSIGIYLLIHSLLDDEPPETYSILVNTLVVFIIMIQRGFSLYWRFETLLDAAFSKQWRS